MGLRTKQVLAVVAGCIVAGVMMLLGLWQMASYEESTRDVSAERAALAPVPLADGVAADGTVDDIYGRRVTLSGSFNSEYQILVGDADPWRVATVFEMDDGRFVTVVRGSVPPGEEPAAPPVGEQSLEGIFLASDAPYDGSSTEIADLPTLRLQQLAQDWPSPLIGGYVTLSEQASAAQGLEPAALNLPEAEGSATHRGYALQWWVFAAGAVAFGVYAARGFAKAEGDAQRRQAEAAATALVEPPTAP